MPKLILVINACGQQGAGDPAKQRRAPSRAVCGDQDEAGEQQNEQPVRVHRLRKQRVELHEGDDHPGEAERQSPGEALTGQAQDEAGRNPDEDPAVRLPSVVKAWPLRSARPPKNSKKNGR